MFYTSTVSCECGAEAGRLHLSEFENNNSRKDGSLLPDAVTEQETMNELELQKCSLHTTLAPHRSQGCAGPAELEM